MFYPGKCTPRQQTIGILGILGKWISRHSELDQSEYLISVA